MSRLLSAALFCAVAFLGCSRTDPTPGDLTMSDPSLREDLSAVAAMKVYFGHQSVGQSIIDGLKELAAANEVHSLRFVPADSLPADGGGYFADSRIGENHKPDLKCEAFDRQLGRLRGAPPDVAMMKFCYSDITRETDVQAVFARYRATVDSLKRALPGVTFVHITIPLTVKTGGVKKILNTVLGRTGNLDMGNVKRQEFNELLRTQFRGEPLFDLARVQSSDPGGEPVTFTFEGVKYPAMEDSYSAEDGSHMNRDGARRAARALSHLLAELARDR